MKRLILSAALASSLAFAQGAPPPAAKGAPPPPPAKGAPPPAPAKAPPPPAAGTPAPAHAPAAGTPAPAPAMAMDWSKVGPGARKPKSEAAVKKEINAWLAEEEKLAAAKNWDGVLARIDFPVTMITDSTSGAVSSRAASREEYLGEMKPFWDNMPADMKTKHKFTISVLSDALAVVVDDFTMTMGKTKVTGRNSSTLVKVGGAWKWKTMTEAGWGDMGAPSAAPAPAAPAPAKAAPAAAAPAPGKAAPAPAAPAPGKAAPPPAPSKGAPPPPPAAK